VSIILSSSTAVSVVQYKKFNVNTRNVTSTWDHYWERCVGSGHASLAMRADYQEQLRKTHRDLGFQQVRFHGLFVDDMSVVLPATDGKSKYMFSFFNIDRIFDYLLSIGMKPLVEISFMPTLLASGNSTWSHYNANITPPKSEKDWSDLIVAFARHLIDRYTLEEVSTWSFEFWNEPNCCFGNNIFFNGTRDDYFNLFKITSRALKSVNSKLRIGGPATAMSEWIPEFLKYCTENQVEFDFISTHEYPTDPPGPQTRTFFSNTIKKTRQIVGPKIPIYYTEYDDGYNDMTAYSAAFVVYQNYMLNNVVDALAWWPFTDIFEEAGLYPDPYNNEWMPVDGLMNVYGIPKPNYRAFQLLHWSGNQLVETTPNLFNSDVETVGVFAVTGNQTSIFIVNWNVKNQPIDDAVVTVTVTGTKSTKAVVYLIDEMNANAYPTWVELGSPSYLNPKQVNVLNKASELVAKDIQIQSIDSDTIQFEIKVPGNTVANVVLL
jgi:xylan 1,4-beta-xylosidase